MLCERLRRIDWSLYFEHSFPLAPDDFPAAEEPGLALEISASTDGSNDAAPPSHGRALSELLTDLIKRTMDIHNVIADVFLNHQAHISTPQQPYLRGFPNGI